MDDSTRARRRPRRAWPAIGRAAAAIVATAGLVLLAAACSGSPSSTSSGSSNAGGSTSSPSAIGYSHCMRSHGVPNFPDPTSSGEIPKVGLQQLGVSSSQFQSAQNACQHLLPNGGQSSQASDQQTMNALYKFALCVRSHGVPNWPDPLAESDPGQPGTPGFPRNLQGINTTSPQVKAAMDKCQHLLAGIGYASGGYP
jgi:hypothetical protein